MSAGADYNDDVIKLINDLSELNEYRICYELRVFSVLPPWSGDYGRFLCSLCEVHRQVT